MHLVGSGSLVSVLDASLGSWMHLLGSVPLLSGSGCSVWSIDWRLYLVEPGLCSAGTGLCLQAQAAGEPLHTHQHMWLHESVCLALRRADSLCYRVAQVPHVNWLMFTLCPGCSVSPASQALYPSLAKIALCCVLWVATSTSEMVHHDHALLNQTALSELWLI